MKNCVCRALAWAAVNEKRLTTVNSLAEFYNFFQNHTLIIINNPSFVFLGSHMAKQQVQVAVTDEAWLYNQSMAQAKNLMSKPPRYSRRVRSSQNFPILLRERQKSAKIKVSPLSSLSLQVGNVNPVTTTSTETWSVNTRKDARCEHAEASEYILYRRPLLQDLSFCEAIPEKY